MTVTDMSCGYAGDRDEAMIAYLYDDGDPAARAGFESHLAACARCRHEMDALRVVRRQLAHWTPPEVNFVVTSRESPVTSHESSVTSHRAWWHEIPAWAQVAAALLVLGASAGVANLDVRYDNTGLSVRTGWAPPPRSTPAPPAVALGTGTAAPWRADLTALEQQMRQEIHALPASAAVSPTRAALTDADVPPRWRALIDESEKRQQRELALKVGEVERDFNAARQADLRKIDYSLNGVHQDVGVVYRQQQEQQQMLLRVSQRQ
jgi:anti-sigma factor RsiW